MKNKIIYLGGIDGYESTSDELSKYGSVVHIQTEADLAINIRDAVAIIDASMKYHLSDIILSQAKKLRVISCATTGSDHIDKNILIEKSIDLFTLKDDKDVLQDLTPAAELSWALLLACARNLIKASLHVKDGLWQRELFPSIMLKGRVIGLVGFGRIGSWMARYAEAFGMKVITYDPYQAEFPSYVKSVNLEELIIKSDFVSVHVHLTEETTKLISRELFSKMKKNVVLINTSRGAILDEEALLHYLKDGKISAAGLDVLSGEPDISNHPLVAYSKLNHNLIITPHCGGFSPDAVRIVCSHASQKIIPILKNAELL